MKELSASRLEADCLAGAADDEDLVCTVYDGTRTRVVRIDAADGSVSPIGYLPGRLVCDRETTRGWLTGWAGATHVAIRLATRQAFRPPDDAAVVHMSVSGDRIAVVSLADDGMRVETYAIPK